MRIFRSARWLLLALLLPLIQAPQARAGVYISVGFAPPVLPVYVQPPCPEEGLMWVPGYWAYGEDGYYWVPGAWVPAPYEGALWTPPYWGWQEGVYVFHPGYWGPEVGYYGGVNYGFGYMGIGFIGGRWHERRFEYNTAIVRVNETVIHTTYIDRTVIREHEVVHDSRVAYAGGPGGIRHDPSFEERHAMQVQHLPPTQFQQQHFEAARNDHSNYFNANHGHPTNVAIARPLPAERHDPPPAMMRGNPGVNGANGNPGGRGEFHNGQPPAAQQQHQPVPESRPMPPARPTYQAPPQQQRPESRPSPEPRYQAPPQQRPNYQAPPPQQRPESRPAPEPRTQAPPQQRPNYQAPPPQQRPESRPAPEPRYQAPPQQRPNYQAPPPQQRPESRPAPEPRYQAPPPQQRPESRPAPPPRQESRPAPAPRQESRPAPEPRHDSRPQHDPKR